MQILFPELKPYKRHQLKVSDKHELYVDESGNVHGIPILFVHGGPGGACDASSRRFYDPSVYRIITFDQRGCGRSTPHGELENNTTQDLICDIEVMRELLDVDRWVLFGGSWGSTLSLLYAQAFPARVLGLILRGIFLCRQCDFDWLYKDGARRVFPDCWEEFVNHIPIDERGDLMKAYYARLTGDDELARMAAAKHWSVWEGNCSKLRPSPEALARFTKPHKALALARLESHYFMNKGFIDENQILENMHLIRDIPSRIVHGRYDMVCPLENALALHKLWPTAELHIVRESGHSGSEPGTVDALIRATADIAKQLENFD
ncbi:MAG: prolyl aminopeptidase [Gammaproteobacteria bacterium]|jgi:proline iminopeptidase|nr:prolyl aminopeptidase [Gammaproteobacteria bacterium]